MAMNPSTKVRCANRQPDLLTGEACGWSGRRQGRVYQTKAGGQFRASPTRERCPKCGSRVEEVLPP